MPAVEGVELGATLIEARRILVPMACVAVLVNGWAYLRVITENDGWGTSVLTTLVGFAFCAWAGVTQWRIERLEDAE